MEFDWLAESLADLGRLIRSLKNFPMPMDFFFDFFAVREIWSAMDMSARRRKNTRHSHSQGPVDISGKGVSGFKRDT